MKIENFKLLVEKLKDKNIKFASVNENGVVIDIDGVTEIQKRSDVAAIITAHNPNEKTEEEQRQAKVEELISANFAGFDLNNLTSTQALKVIKILYILAGLADKNGIIK